MNIFKKVTAVGALAATLALGFGAQGASAAGWTTVGSDYFNASRTSWGYDEKSPVYKFSGGNMGVKIPEQTVHSHAGDEAVLQVQLYEYDPGDGNDTFLGVVYYYPQSEGTRTYSMYIGNLVDGDNGKAEIYGKYSTNYDGSPVYIKYLD